MRRPRLARSLAGKAAAVVAVASALALYGAPGAQATTCSAGGLVCGEVWNDSDYWIMIGGGNEDSHNGWCESDNAPVYGNPKCINALQLEAGAESDDGSHFKDADSFRVDAGCMVKFWNNSPISTNWTSPITERIEDRRGKALDKWIKVFDNDAMQITQQTCGGTPTKYEVDTLGTAYGYQDQYCLDDGGSGSDARCNRDGELYAGTNYVFCKEFGDTVEFDDGKNYYWLLTDLDTVYDGRDGRAFISAYYLSHWGDNEAKDNAGREIPDC